MPPQRQFGLRGFMAFCSGGSYEPAAINQDTVLAFEVWSTDNTLCRNLSRTIRRITSTWNWARRNVASWPTTPLARAVRPERYTLPPEAYPATCE
jgi:hypothetical protein